MVWDATAYQYTLHALGAVEASMDYGATNPSDVISVGILQWYAQRAANVLNEMKTANPADWAGVTASLANDIIAHPANDSFWSNRYLFTDERSSLHTVMSTAGNIIVQDTQATNDIDNDYLPAGAAIGIDKDVTPETMAFFINIFNRNPTGARRIVANCGGDSSLDRIYAFTLNDQTEGASFLRNRYKTAYDIIKAHDTTGVGSGVGGPDPGGTPGGNNGGGGRPSGNAAYIQQRGGQLILFNKDNTKLIFQKTATDIWLSGFDENAGVPVPPPTGTGGGPVPTAIADMIAWETSVIGNYSYCDGCGGRLDPPSSGLSDCSGLQYYAYKTYAHIDIGNWTGDQINHGRLITKDPTVAKDGSTVIEGDLIFYRWSSSSPSTFDHVEIYAGGGQNLSHGGPGKGPHFFNSNGEIDNAIGGGGSIEVRRYL